MKILNAAVLMVAVCFVPGAPADAIRVPGEKLDSGLGDLPSSYTAQEFMPASGTRVLGEKLDSGLGELTREDPARIRAAYTTTTARK